MKKWICRLLILAMLLTCLPAYVLGAGGEVSLSKESFPDPAFREYVAYHFDKDRNTRLSQEELESVEELSLKDLNIQDLTGVDFFTALRRLDCSGNAPESGGE